MSTTNTIEEQISNILELSKDSDGDYQRYFDDEEKEFYDMSVEDEIETILSESKKQGLILDYATKSDDVFDSPGLDIAVFAYSYVDVDSHVHQKLITFYF